MTRLPAVRVPALLASILLAGVSTIALAQDDVDFPDDTPVPAAEAGMDVDSRNDVPVAATEPGKDIAKQLARLSRLHARLATEQALLREKLALLDARSERIQLQHEASVDFHKDALQHQITLYQEALKSVSDTGTIEQMAREHEASLEFYKATIARQTDLYTTLAKDTEKTFGWIMSVATWVLGIVTLLVAVGGVIGSAGGVIAWHFVTKGLERAEAASHIANTAAEKAQKTTAMTDSLDAQAETLDGRLNDIQEKCEELEVSLRAIIVDPRREAEQLAVEDQGRRLMSGGPDDQTLALDYLVEVRLPSATEALVEFVGALDQPADLLLRAITELGTRSLESYGDRPIGALLQASRHDDQQVFEAAATVLESQFVTNSDAMDNLEEIRKERGSGTPGNEAGVADDTDGRDEDKA